MSRIISKAMRAIRKVVKSIHNRVPMWYNNKRRGFRWRDERRKSMANVFDVATYILGKCGTMSTMKLQKLCYYCQAWSLVWDDVPLFEEEFCAWANGPVCKELFFRTQGKFSVNASDENGDVTKISKAGVETIDRVLDYYAPHDAQWLSQLTHLEAPWKRARKGVPPGVGCDNIITKESMAEYYGGL